MERKNSMLTGVLLLTGANLLLRLFSIGFHVFLTDRIGAAGLGLLQLISTVSIFASLVGTSGVRVASMYLAAEEFAHGRRGGVRIAVNTCLRWGLLLSCLAGSAVFFSAETIAVTALKDIRATLSLQVMGLFLPFSCLCGIMTGYFTACSRIRQLVAIEIGERVCSMGITAFLLLFWSEGDLSRSCCAILLGSSIGCVLDFLLLYGSYRKDVAKALPPREPLHMGARLRRLCIPLALNDYLRAGLNTAEQLLIPLGLAAYGGSGTRAMADYGTIHAMVFPVLMFPAAILYSVSDLLVPELSRSKAVGRRHRILDLTDKCVNLGLLFGCGVCGFFLLCGQELGVLLYDSCAAGRYLQIFAPLVILLYLDAITDGMLKGLAEQVACVRYNTLTSLLDVLLLWQLLPRWGIGGYVFSFTLTHGINLILSLARLLKVTAYRPRLWKLLMPLLCTGLSLCLSLPLFPVGNGTATLLILKGGCFLLLFLAIALLTNALPEDYCRWLYHLPRKKSSFP